MHLRSDPALKERHRNRWRGAYRRDSYSPCSGSGGVIRVGAFVAVDVSKSTSFPPFCGPPAAFQPTGATAV